MQVVKIIAEVLVKFIIILVMSSALIGLGTFVSFGILYIFGIHIEEGSSEWFMILMMIWLGFVGMAYARLLHHFHVEKQNKSNSSKNHQ